jgi:signal transduction histidine kinase
MRLSDFLVRHRDQILSEWDTFARSGLITTDGKRPVADEMSFAALRDHASEILDAIAMDLNTSQTNVEQAEKSEGKSDAPVHAAADTAAQAHGAGRALSGFTVEQMVSEYRALRASVIRLWIESAGEVALTDVRDLIRFNEAIDQALAESTSRFTQNIDRSKEIFLGMLGHDLRNPLGAIIGSAHIMVNTEGLPSSLQKNASLILRSGRRMHGLVGDLLDFTRSRLGDGIPIVREELDLAMLCRQTVDEIAAIHPQRVVNLETTGQLQGQWDGARVSQALSNVINNAVEHGSDNTPINVTIRAEGDDVELGVQNWGPVIPTDQLDKIFAPMHRIEADNLTTPSSNLGLGLYITERIVAAHGGTIVVHSSDEGGTTFTIRLAKRMRTARSSELNG